MADFLIIRHAEPALRGVLLGQCDPALSEAGRLAATELAGRVRVASVLASPLRRARETAQAFGVEVVIVDEFREWGYGAWDGLSWQEIEARFPEEAKKRSADWLGYAAPGQESWREFAARVEVGWTRACALPRPVAIVAHEAVNSVLWTRLYGGDPLQFRQKYCEILEA